MKDKENKLIALFMGLEEDRAGWLPRRYGQKTTATK